MKINRIKSWIIGMMIMALASTTPQAFAQSPKAAPAPTAATVNADVEPTIGGRVYVGLKFHVPFWENGKLCFLGHFVLDNMKGDLVDNNATEWVTIAAPTRRMARKLKKMNKPFLADYIQITGKSNKSYYLISNWQPTGDKVDDKIK